MKNLIVLLIIAFISIQNIDAKIYTSIKTGDWNDESTWDCGKVPPKWISFNQIIVRQGDSVYISEGNSGINITTPGKLIIEGSLYTVSPVKVNTGGTLDVYGDLYINSPMETALSGNINIGAGGYIGVNGSISVGAGSNFDNGGVVATSGGDYYSSGSNGFGDIGGKVLYNQSSVIPKPSSVILPIALESFTVTKQNSKANFIWKTVSEKNNDYFTIEQSSDLNNWKEVHTEFGAGNSSIELTYNAQVNLDRLGVYYFRLKQTDYDGKFSYSDIVSLINNEIGSELIPKAIVRGNEIFVENSYHTLQIFNVFGNVVGEYHNRSVINNLEAKGILILVFDNKYNQKITKNF